jgi:hypothetical protein
LLRPTLLLGERYSAELERAVHDTGRNGVGVGVIVGGAEWDGMGWDGMMCLLALFFAREWYGSFCV